MSPPKVRPGTSRDAPLRELIHVGHVTTARMTQLMLLLNLAPDWQEQIFYAGDSLRLEFDLV